MDLLGDKIKDKAGDYSWGSRGLVNDLKKIITRHPQKNAFNYGMSIINILQEDYAEAIKNLKAFLERNPDAQLIHRRLGELFIYCSKYEAALSHLEKAVELDPEDLTALTWLSLTYYRLGEAEKALSKLKLLEHSVLVLSVSYNHR